MARSWTADEVKRLKELWRQGLSDRQIGERLGRPHNSISCKRSDLGLSREPRPRWTAARTERLKHLWCKQDWKSTAIAKEFGIGRGAVLGKLNRLGLVPRHRGSGKRPPPPTMHQRRLNAAAATPELTAEQIEARKEAERQRDSEARKLKAEAARGALRLHMAASRTAHAHSSGRPYRVFRSDLGAGVCRFPLNDGGPFEFCGKPCGDATYCDAHQSLCYKAPGGDLAYMAKF